MQKSPIQVRCMNINCCIDISFVYYPGKAQVKAKVHGHARLLNDNCIYKL